MKNRKNKRLPALIFAFALMCVVDASAQIQATGGGYYVAGYGTVYGSFGQADAAQGRMYDQVKVQNRRISEHDAQIKNGGFRRSKKPNARPPQKPLHVPIRRSSYSLRRSCITMAFFARPNCRYR